MSKSIPRFLSLALLGVAGVVATQAQATPIGPSGFGAAQIVESFEGIPLGANIRLGMGVSLLEPGTVGAYAFASGVVLSAPVPNPGVMSQGAFVHDFARGSDVQNNWGATGTVDDPSDVPFGDAYLGAFHASGGTAAITLSFASPMDRVGAYVTGVAGSTVTMRVYDASGVLLESVSTPVVPLGSWASNFLGVQQPGRIARVVFTAPDFGLDALTFEDDALLVPEPATLPILALGLLGLWSFGAITRPRTGRARS